MLTVLLLALVFFIGATMQRVSGMGVGLLAGPVLSLVLGPIEGILVVNVIAAVNAAMSTWNVRGNVQWKMVTIIGSVMVLGSLPAAWLITKVSTPVLQIVVGLLLVWALLTVTIGKRHVPTIDGKVPAMLSGVMAGFMNTVAGVAGPAITVYALASRWPQIPYSATLQPLFVMSGLISFTLKTISGSGDLSSVHWTIWPAGVIACIIGIAVGARLSHKVDRGKARNLAVTVALLGAVSVLVRGVASL